MAPPKHKKIKLMTSRIKFLNFLGEIKYNPKVIGKKVNRKIILLKTIKTPPFYLILSLKILYIFSLSGETE